MLTVSMLAWAEYVVSLHVLLELQLEDSLKDLTGSAVDDNRLPVLGISQITRLGKGGN